ncbi:MAG: protein-methionine-sulfoxide reductase catalytic subunit MsrP [Candidatus Acidiferrum sp.]
MSTYRQSQLNYSDVTPQSVYVNRRRFLRALGIGGAAAVVGGGSWELGSNASRVYATSKLNIASKSPLSTTEKQTPYDDVTHYNNFYEFGTDKTDPAKNSQKFRTSPWTVSVEGEVKTKKKFSMDDIVKLAPLEERIYRHRCVEGWSIVVPWIGYSFSSLANVVEPTPKAKYVAFESYYDIGQMPQSRFTGLQYPYVEGLRLDEAMNPLALLCVGMYGETLPNQDGAPVRMVLPWKYGFKSIKSLVKIRFVEKQPPTTWNISASQEYGFYSNVNPKVDHPRWSQAKERRLGEVFKRETLMFNGYGDQVASMYAGMDLKKNY